jgi:hypothetical protein
VVQRGWRGGWRGRSVTPCAWCACAGALEREVAPLGELLRLNPERSSLNLWAGQAGVVAPCHYDGHHNFYAQLWGKKRFLLWPPSAWPLLRPFPLLHPSHAQCQTNVSAALHGGGGGGGGAGATVAAAAVDAAWRVELSPGELLYIPPLWFHETEALSATLSVNAWTETPPSRRLSSALYPLPPPPRPSQSDDEDWLGGGGSGAAGGGLAAARRVAWGGVAVAHVLRGVAVREARERQRWAAEEEEEEEPLEQSEASLADGGGGGGAEGSWVGRLPRLRLRHLSLSAAADTALASADGSDGLSVRAHLTARYERYLVDMAQRQPPPPPPPRSRHEEKEAAAAAAAPELVWGDDVSIATLRAAVRRVCQPWTARDPEPGAGGRGAQQQVQQWRRLERWSVEVVDGLLAIPRAERVS